LSKTLIVMGYMICYLRNYNHIKEKENV
jgi:hypothetical protein